MKKSNLALLILFFVMFACSNVPNDLSKSGLKGKVKSVKETQYEPTYEDDHWVAGNPAVYGGRVVDYDEDGRYVQSYTIGNTGDTIGISTCKRENGVMVEENYRSLYEPNTSRTLLERISDEEIHFEVWQNGQLFYEGANYFDGKGRIIRQVQVGNEREVTIHYVYEKDLLVENYREEFTGERSATQLYEYDEFDEKGNWTVKLIYAGDEKITPSVVIKREISYY